MRMVRVPIGMDEYQQDFATEAAMGATAELLRMLIKTENVQASVQILRLVASPR